jgi:predicted MFS family arabinose efflux permease
MDATSFRPFSLALGGLIALAVAMGIGRFAYTPILPFMADSLHLSKSEAGLIASANFAGYLLGALAAATPRLPGSRRFWLMGGLTLSALTTILTAAWTSVPMLTGMRFLGGVASAFVLVFASSVILERLAEAGQSRLAAVHFAGVGVGIALSSAIVSALAAGGSSWETQWIAIGIVALVATPLVAWLVPAEARRTSGGAAGSALPSITGRLAALIAAYGLFGFGYVITATFLVAIVRGSAEVRHLEPVIWMIFGLAAVPSVALWSALAQRIGIFTAYAIASIVQAAGVAASVLVMNSFGAVLAALFLGCTFMGMTALGLVGARQMSTSDPRQVLALMTGAFGIGQIVGPLLAGALFDATGSFTLPSLMAAAALFLAAGLAFGASRASRSDEPGTV